MPEPMRKAIADEWTGQHCWLNGRDAKVTGRLNQFATIATLDGELAVDFAWHTVNNIMRRHREFRT